jgi:hypothetical protein
MQLLSRLGREIPDAFYFTVFQESYPFPFTFCFEPRALYMLGKCSTIGLCPWPLSHFLIELFILLLLNYDFMFYVFIYPEYNSFIILFANVFTILWLVFSHFQHWYFNSYCPSLLIYKERVPHLYKYIKASVLEGGHFLAHELNHVIPDDKMPNLHFQGSIVCLFAIPVFKCRIY